MKSCLYKKDDLLYDVTQNRLYLCQGTTMLSFPVCYLLSSYSEAYKSATLTYSEQEVVDFDSRIVKIGEL